MQQSHRQLANLLSRRIFFGQAGSALGAAALLSLGESPLQAATRQATAKAKRVIYLCQSGAPSQHDLFDYKPMLSERQGEELPDSIRDGQRLTGMTADQTSFPLTPSIFPFAQHGQSGAWFSSAVPHMAKLADDICIVHSMHTEAINHDPAMTLLQTGTQQPGRPSLGAWVSYGLGSENADLPAFVVLISRGSSLGNQQPLADKLWGSAFLPAEHQGVKFRGGGDPILYLGDPAGVSRQSRREMIAAVAQLNRLEARSIPDPEIEARIAQYELAYRMQSSAPELVDFRDEPEATFALYGEQARQPGTFAANCLLARRLAERDVRFIQLYHRGWDQHLHLPRDLARQCGDVDKASAALVTDLKNRGLLEDTLVVWGGEFGRTAYCQGELTADDYGRDHHPRCFTIWMAGGGVRPGIQYGKTDEFGYNVVENPVHIHDLNATILHQLGVNHLDLTYRYQGRDFRLTDIAGNVVSEVLKS
ncbi:DUF1501 domain-containing protein [Blastopirellula marina]|uniref:Sulfatase n=1 Tax=Blastopirellula marina TaxID=124 RepID=A0A2S8F3S2_9BACT|nr:DUF1501 domain-containing protein [Blastopirellula marina]PQO26801.1 sulfatase [Blastopirellula marina]PQO41488.1 sulfatase [Blastopirellula marina]PTL41008.1 DUF1501 domain-containing protein [Blastopirellula marina]